MPRIDASSVYDRTRICVGLLMAEENLAIVEQILTTARANLKMARSRYESGFVVKSDLLRSQLQIANLEQQQLQAASQVEIYRAELQAAMGVAIDQEFELVSRLDSRLESPTTWNAGSAPLLKRKHDQLFEKHPKRFD